MKKNEITFPMSQVVRQVSLKVSVSGAEVAAIRLWLGTRLFRFAAWVIGCGIEIDAPPPQRTLNVDGTPRRLSVGDHNYDHSVGLRLDVFLDGVEQKEVVSYDSDCGELVRFARDNDGSLIVKDDEAVKETLHGKVEVRWRPGL